MPTVSTDAGDLRVRTDYPGANGRVVDAADDAVTVAPELRDSVRRPMYWNVEVESAVERTVRVELTEPVVPPRGPAVCREREPWTWLGADARVDDAAFTYEFAAGERVRFALSLPYQVADFEAFYEAGPGVAREVLTRTEGGRPVPLVRVGSVNAARHVVLAARHHACEAPASYALEGFLAAATEGGGDADAGPLPPDVCVHAVPFVDLDGVERGDQGKHRAPHDHNRDYVDGNALSDDLGPIYRATAAVMDYVRGLAAGPGRVALAIDFHCPYAWGEDNDRPFLVADPDDLPPAVGTLADRLAAATADAPLSFDPAPGVGVHGFRGQEGLTHTFTRFAERQGADPAVSLEVPFVGTEADPVTPASARELGRGLATAAGDLLADDGGA